MIKKKLINIFLGISVFLLLVNLIVENIIAPEKSDSFPGMSVTEVENQFLNVLNEYGILQEWIKVTNKKYPNQDSLSHYFKIDFPEDITIPEFIFDIKANLPDSISVLSLEKKKHGGTTVQIFSKGIQLLQAVINYNEGIIRACCGLSFIIRTPDEFDEVTMRQIKNFPYPFSISLIPSFENAAFIEKLEGLDKNYVMLLNNEIPEGKFQLHGSTSRNRMKGAINSIVTSFGDKVSYLIDDHSEIYSSTSMNFIRDEFTAKGIELHLFSKLVKFEGKSFDEISSRVKFYCSSEPMENNVTFLLNFEELLKLKELMSQAKKKGHKIRLFNSTIMPIEADQKKPIP